MSDRLPDRSSDRLRGRFSDRLCDRRGAVLVFGVFAAVFLTATLYYVLGIAGALGERQALQDAADRAVFSAAALHARGMNLLSLINLLMAALLAVLVALKLVEAVLTVAIVVLLALSWWSPPLATLAAQAEALREEIHEVHASLEPEVETGLETLHLIARGVRSVVPWAAQLEAAREAARDPAVRVGFVLPERTSLPVEDEDFAVLCGKAGEDVAELSAKLIPDPLLVGPVGAALDDLTRSGAAWFCGDDAAATPSTRVTYELSLPELPARAACNREVVDPARYDMQEHAETCQSARDEEERAQPDELGYCRRDCGPDGIYQLGAALARTACAPRAGRRLSGFTWRKERVAQRYVRRGGQWQPAGAAEILSAELVRDDAAPCGWHGALLSPEWHERRALDADGVANPVCSDGQAPGDGGRGMTSARVEYTRAAEVFGCKERRTRSFSLADEYQDDSFAALAGDDASAKAPQRLEPGLALGTAAFQLRGRVLGEPRHDIARGVLSVASWSARDNPMHHARFDAWRVAGAQAVAQAEYYYAVEGDADDDAVLAQSLWDLRWQARLRRVEPARANRDQQDAGAAGDLVGRIVALDPGSACAAAARLAGGDSAACAALAASWIDELSLH